MSENIDINSNANYEEGLTFKQIGHFFKKALPRIILFALVALVAAAVVCLPIHFFTGTESVQMVVDYSFTGIDKGLDPNGGEFDSNSILEPNVVQKALDAQSLELDSTDVINAIAVQSVIPASIRQQLELLEANAQNSTDSAAIEALAEFKYYPTRYLLSFESYDALEITQTQAIGLLNEILAQYKTEFKNTYGSVNINIGSGVLDLSTIGTADFSYGYYETLELLADEISLARSYISSFDLSANPTYKYSVTSESFADLDLKLISLNNIDLYSLYLNITTSGVASSSLEYLQSRCDEINIDIANYTTLRDDQKVLVDNYKSVIQVVTSDGSITDIQAATETYNNMLTTLTNYNDKLSSSKLEQAKLQRYIDNLTTAPTPTAETIASTGAKIKELSTSINNIVDTIENMSEEYSYNYKLKNGITSPTGAVAVSIGAVPLTTCAIVIIIATLGGAVVAMIVHGVKSKNNK